MSPEKGPVTVKGNESSEPTINVQGICWIAGGYQSEVIGSSKMLSDRVFPQNWDLGCRSAPLKNKKHVKTKMFMNSKG